MSFLSKDVGIDLGTANTLVYMKGKGIIMREPSVVAVDTKTDEVRCVGGEAKAVIGRTPGSIVAVRPLKDGVIADFDITANMLENFLKKACGNSMFSRPRVVICIPSGVTEVERRAVREATLKAGARQVSVIEEPMAAAIGAGLPISEPTGSMIVDIGGGTAEIAVIWAVLWLPAACAWPVICSIRPSSLSSSASTTCSSVSVLPSRSKSRSALPMHWTRS